MSFDALRLSTPIVRAVASEGYENPTPIQAQAIPPALEGRDIFGCAQTGTGKTCAFALPILHQLAGDIEPDKGRQGRLRRGRAPRALVLCPTRELASQIFDSFVTYGRQLPLRHAVIFGGVNQRPQVRKLEAGVDVLIATPGRLLDLMNQGYVRLDDVECLVLDEADRMLDMGFIHDIRRVTSQLPEKRQTLFFSATASKEIRKLAAAMLQNPVRIDVTPEATTADMVEQWVYMVRKQNKATALQRILSGEDIGRTLVFTRTKHGADRLVRVLRRSSHAAEAIHGNKSQNARTRAMNGFRSGQVRVLVATDIAARGIDVDEVTHVVNYDMPVDSETYVHRIGRTARAGASGVALSLCDTEEIGLLRAIERRTRSSIRVGAGLDDLIYDHAAEGREAGGRGRPQKKGRRPGGPRGSGRRNGTRSANRENGSADRSRRRENEHASDRRSTPKRRSRSQGKRPGGRSSRASRS